MAAVYLAADPRLNRKVALKILNAKYAADEQARMNFAREADFAAKLEHLNIVTIYGCSHPDEPEPWLSMRHISGGDTGKLVKKHPRGLPLERALRLTSDAAHALQYGHTCGVLHRDVKPGNLLVDHDPRHGERAVLTDFGIACALDGTSTVSVDAWTLPYAAPELFEGAQADFRADIYSLGCTLFEFSPAASLFRIRTNVRTSVLI